ncbi:MAG: hypothetical protein HGA45_41400 [Chloroflexales bacterium]|nr:hypothetical protein [Chloroflexales bacterium]
MARYETLDTDHPDYYDSVVEVGFAQQLSAPQVAHVLQRVAAILDGEAAARIFEGFSHFQLTAMQLHVHFRFARGSLLPQLSGADLENLSRLRPQFIFYFFAIIDATFPLADVPFPAEFREFIILPDHLDV